MYSRFPPKHGQEMKIPEHYSGHAFSKAPSTPHEPPQATTPRGGEPHASVNPPPLSTTPPEPSPTALPSLPKASTLIHPNRLLSGISFEELLILGLILLLSGTGEGDDLPLWLFLLLFCK